MKEIKYYESADGILFPSRETCIEHEKKAKEAIVDKFKNLIVRKAESMKITDEGCAFPLAEFAECWWYAVIVMHNVEDYNTVCEYAKLTNENISKIEKVFNKEIFVSIGDGDRDECEFDSFHWYGTIEDAIAGYTKALLTFGGR